MINQSTDLTNVNVRGFYYTDHFNHLVEGMAASAVSKPNTGITPKGTYCLNWVKQNNKAFGFVSISKGLEIKKEIFTDYSTSNTITEVAVITAIVEIPFEMLTYRSQSLPNDMVAAAIEYVLLNA